MLEDCVISLPKEGVVWTRFWEDECVIYNQLTGETHLVDGIGAQVFKCISEKAAARTALLNKIHSIFEWPIDYDIETSLDNLLLEYQKLGLLQVMENNTA